MTWDIKLNPDGTMPLYPQLHTGRAKIAQAVAIGLKQHKEEWLPDETAGMAYQEWIRNRWQPLQAIGGQIRQEMLAVEGVVDVQDFSIRRVLREILVTATLIDSTGESFLVEMETDTGPSGNVVPLVYFSFHGKRHLG